MIVALLLQSFCTGIFVGTLELEANTVFLEAFGADRVPFALMVSGLAGILIAAIYGYFSRQLKTRFFAYLNLVVVIGVGILFVGGLHFLEQDYLDFATFVFSGPLILITLLGFWTTVRGKLSSSRSKQLGGLIEVTLVGGMIVALLSTPLLVSSGFRIHEVLYAGMGSLIIAASAQLYVLSKHGEQREGYREKAGSAGPIRLFSNRYTASMASFVVIGVAVSVLLHYEFLSVTQNRFPGEVNLLSSWGFFLELLLCWPGS